MRKRKHICYKMYCKTIYKSLLVWRTKRQALGVREGDEEILYTQKVIYIWKPLMFFLMMELCQWQVLDRQQPAYHPKQLTGSLAVNNQHTILNKWQVLFCQQTGDHPIQVTEGSLLSNTIIDKCMFLTFKTSNQS